VRGGCPAVTQRQQSLDAAATVLPPSERTQPTDSLPFRCQPVFETPDVRDGVIDRSHIWWTYTLIIGDYNGGFRFGRFLLLGE